MQDPAGKPRAQGSSLSLSNLLQSLGIEVQCTLHNAGNDAFMALLALQTLLDPANTKPPAMRGRAIQQNMMRNASRSPAAAHGLPGGPMPLSPPVMAMYGLQVPSPLLYPLPPQSPALTPDVQDAAGSRRSSGYFVSQQGLPPGGQRPRKTSGLAPADGRGTLSRRGSAGVDEAAERLSNMRV